MLGLGSIIGTGVFVSLGIAAGVAGPAVILAVAVGAVVASCNGLSSAQLAANHPVSGGTYEYGYRWLHPALGFTAGWTFLLAKSASAATAALGLSGYLLESAQRGGQTNRVILGLVILIILTAVVISGLRRSNLVNTLIVSVTLLSLAYFVAAGFLPAIAKGTENLTPFFPSKADGQWQWSGLLEASALMFVAYTGYGRIATLGEEIHQPKRNIPIAIITTLVVSMIVYLSVGVISVAAVGAEEFAAATNANAASLQSVARSFRSPSASFVVAVGAATAMAGVLLNLLLGLSRVVLAMSRRRDLPNYFARVDGPTPVRAVWLVAGIVAGLILTGDVKTTWSFSAFAVLIYYAITNLAATRLNADERLYHRGIPWAGMFFCLFLAFWVQPVIWMCGLGLIAGGLIWHRIAQWKAAGSETDEPT